MTATEFTPLASLIGGMMIGVSAVGFMASHGRIAGISGIVSRLLPPYQDKEWTDRLAFIIGLVVAPLVYTAVAGTPVHQMINGNMVLMIAAGLLVGFGSVWGNGCTSGHGVCGMSRLSMRSIIATLTFMSVATAAVFVQRHVIGG